MPPPGNPQPPQKDVDSFAAWMENTLDSHPKGPNGGLCSDPAPEPHRVRRIGESFGGRGREREGRPAAGHPGGGLRQHRGRVERVARVPRSVRHRRAARGETARSAIPPASFECEVLHRGQPEPATSPCLPARAAACGSSTISRPTASIASISTTFRWACTPALWRTRARW